MQERRRLQGRFIGWAAVAVLATYCLFIGGAWAPTYSVFFRVVTLILAGAGIAVWIVVAIRDPFWRPRTVFAPAFAAAFTVLLISTALSRYPRFGAEYLAWSAILTALYLILQRLMASEFFRTRLLGFTVLTALVIGVWYVFAVVNDWTAWWGMVGRIAAPPLRPRFESLTLGNPSAVLTASLLLTAPAVAHLAGGGSVRKVAAGVMVALSLFVALLSGSRAGWLAIAAATIIVGLLWLASPGRRASLGAVARSRIARLVAIPVVLAAAGAAVVVGPGLVARAGAGGEGLRTSFFSASIRMFESAPLTGVGPGSWAPLRGPFTAAGEFDYYIPHAHSVYFETIAELGLIGVIGGVIVIAFLARLLVGAIRDTDPARRPMGWAALFTCVYFAAHQALDFYENAPAILFAFVIPIAFLDATAGVAPARQTETRRGLDPAASNALALAGAVVLVGAFAFLSWSERGAFAMSAGTVQLDQLDPPSAIEPLRQATADDAAMPPYHLAYGLALADTGAFGAAEAEFLASAGVDDLPETWVDVAAVRARLDDGRGARDALDRAMRLGIQQSGVLMGIGVVRLELGDTDAATEAFAQALALSPSLAGDSWWTAEAKRAAVWPAAYAAAMDRSLEVGRFTLALEHGDAAAVEDVIASMPEESLVTTSRLVAGAWNGNVAARAGPHPPRRGVEAVPQMGGHHPGLVQLRGRGATGGEGTHGGQRSRHADLVPRSLRLSPPDPPHPVRIVAATARL
jgi:O-antigen ligase